MSATLARGESLKITLSMTATCAIGALLLGGIYLGTDRYAEAARIKMERNAILEMLALPAGADIVEIEQSLDRAAGLVLYRGESDGRPLDLAFDFDGHPVAAPGTAGEAAGGASKTEPLGRLFVARQDGRPAGFVIEGETPGYKNRIRFFVALDAQFQVAAVRGLEHEEDPGLGAEVATPLFRGQYDGRTAEQVARLDVTRDPMPEDWRKALLSKAILEPEAWRTRFAPLAEREAGRPIYAVTGATISSRAMTDGVRTTVDHFRRRWELLAPHFGGGS